MGQLAEDIYRDCGFKGCDTSLEDVWVNGYPLASLFAYRGLVRQLILDFKVNGSWQSGVALVKIFVEDEGVRDWVKGADYIMPVPSSVWGRWRGKHDLAFGLAEGLSRSLEIPLIKAPWSKYFRFKKQSFLSRPERLSQSPMDPKIISRSNLLKVSWSPKNDTNLHGHDAPLIILIDDIVTSAKTLTALAGAIRNSRLRFLTLASAYHAPTPKS
ncbi:MAG: ComF family protein [Chitinophagaceae bacterium]|nr:ComF family protein [Oligoflexus sp.]